MLREYMCMATMAANCAVQSIRLSAHCRDLTLLPSTYGNLHHGLAPVPAVQLVDGFLVDGLHVKFDLKRDAAACHLVFLSGSVPLASYIIYRCLFG
jgi:hypothetical protein